LTALLFTAAVSAAHAQTTDKSDDTLFNAVPDDQLRPLTSAVYDGIQDARTLDAGHFQVESALLDYSFNATTPRGYDKDEFAWDPRITVGVLNNVDIFVRPSFGVTDTFSHGTSSEFGTITTGAKVNLWGNDGGTTALAIRPYLAIPTSGGDLLGGADVALLVRLPQGFYLKFDSEFYATENDSDRLFAGFDNGMSLNKNLCAQVNVYAYLNTIVTSDPNQTWFGSAGLGLEYNFTSNLQLFGGMGFGFTPDWVYGETRAYDYDPRLGIVWRF
jgi:hypothetical protein